MRTPAGQFTLAVVQDVTGIQPQNPIRAAAGEQASGKSSQSPPLAIGWSPAAQAAPGQRAGHGQALDKT